MSETAFEVRVPSALLQFGIDQNEIQRRLNEWLVLSLFTVGHISSGSSAAIGDEPRRVFGLTTDAGHRVH